MLVTLILRNAMRHKLRTILTVLGLAVAVMAFGLIRTVIGVGGAALIAIPLFDYSIFSMGLPLLAVGVSGGALHVVPRGQFRRVR